MTLHKVITVEYKDRLYKADMRISYSASSAGSGLKEFHTDFDTDELDMYELYDDNETPLAEPKFIGKLKLSDIEPSNLIAELEDQAVYESMDELLSGGFPC